VGRGHLALAALAVALLPAAAAPAAAGLHWRELARGAATVPHGALPAAVVVTSPTRARALDSELPAAGRAALAAVDWKTTVVVAVFGEFGCSDGRVAVTAVTRRGDALVVALAKRPLPPGTAECQAIFPTYRLLAFSRASLGTPVPTTATVRWGVPRPVAFSTVARGTTTPDDSSLHAYVARSRAGEGTWLDRLGPRDRHAATAVPFASHVVLAVFLDDAPCASRVTPSVTRAQSRVTVRVTYTRPPIGVATCVRTSTAYVVLSVSRAAVAGAHVYFVSVARA
jgi:hypothetical protein